MAQLVVGLLAHVDAGKTTLAEAMLHVSGAIRRAGRVDHGDTHLDIDDTERRRGITIFSSPVSLERGDRRVALIDTPGHVDFSTEAERTLQVLDCAVLVCTYGCLGWRQLVSIHAGPFQDLRPPPAIHALMISRRGDFHPYMYGRFVSCEAVQLGDFQMQGNCPWGSGICTKDIRTRKGLPKESFASW